MISLDWRGVGLLILAGAAAVWYVKNRALPDVAAAVADPANPVNQAAEATFQAVTGRDDTPGGWLYEVGHNDGQPGPDNFFFAMLDRLAGVDSTGIQEVTQ